MFFFLFSEIQNTKRLIYVFLQFSQAQASGEHMPLTGGTHAPVRSDSSSSSVGVAALPPVSTGSPRQYARAPPPPDPSRFAAVAPFRDLVWAALFIVHSIVVVALAIYYSQFPVERRLPNFWRILSAASGVAVATATVWLVLLRRCTAVFVWVALGGCAVSLITIGACYFGLAESAAIAYMYPFMIALAFALLVCVALYVGLRDRADFAHAMMETSVQFMRRYSSALVVVYCIMLVKVRSSHFSRVGNSFAPPPVSVCVVLDF